MKESSKHLLLIVVVSQLLSLAFFTVFSILNLDRTIAPPLQFGWLTGCVLERWTGFFIPVSLGGILLGISVFGTGKNANDHVSGKIQGGVLIILLFFMVVHIVLMAFVEGPAKNWQQQAIHVSREFQQNMDDAAELLRTHQYATALEKAKAAIGLIPDHEAAVRLRDELLRSMDKVRVDIPAEEMSEGKADEKKGGGAENGWTYPELMTKAREYLAQQDYFTALYFLNLAEVNRQDDQVFFLMEEARAGAMNLVVEEKDAPNKERFTIKLNAIMDLIPLGKYEAAYFQLLKADTMARDEGVVPERAPGSFRYLAAESLPEEGYFADPDVRLWMPLVHEKLMEISFFADEIEQANRQNSHGSLVFKNMQEQEKTMFVYFREMIPVDKLTCLVLAPEILVLDVTGKTIAHWRSESGKIINKRLLLKSIDKDNPEVSKGAVLLQGKADLNLLNVVELSFSADELFGFAKHIGGVGNLTLGERISLFEPMQKAGLDTSVVEISFMNLFARAVSGICLALLAWILGHTLHSRYLTKPVMLIVLSIPLLVVFSIFIFDIYMYGMEILNQLLYGAMGFWGGIWAQLGAQSILLLVLLFMFASISARED